MITSAPPAVLVRFAEFAFDRQSRTLFKDGKELKIQGQPVEILAMLLEHPGQVVAREEIERRLWPDGTFVEFEHSLNAAIRRLREALGDDRETPRFIETVPRRGYRFVARVAGPSRFLQKRWAIALMTAAVLAIAGATLVYFLPRSPVLAERSQIVIADMVNRTGEPIFDGALKTALAVSLEESPFLSIVSDERIREMLKLMTRNPDEPVIDAVAREVCLRANAQAVLTSSIARLGSDYVITLEAVRCSDGNVLARRQEEAANKEQVLPAIRRATSKLRRRLGESGESLQKHNTPLAQATTPSLEALQAYSRGLKLTRTGNYRESAVFFDQALKLDPSFATARMWLAVAKWFGPGDNEGTRQDATAAYEMRNRASERERYLIVAEYHERVTYDLDEAIRNLEAFRDAYPDDPLAHHWLGGDYAKVGRFDDTIREMKERLRLGGPHIGAYNLMAACYRNMNQIDNAQRTLEDAMKQGLAVYEALAHTAAARGDRDAEEKWLTRWAAASNRGQPWVIYRRAVVKVHGGELRDSRKYYRQAMQSAKTHEQEIQARRISDLQFTVEARLEQTAEARAILREYPGTTVGTSLTPGFIQLADIGEFVHAEELAAEASRRFPHGTILQRMHLPLFRAMLAMHRSDPGQAIEELRPAEAYEIANWDTGQHVVYTRGYAHLAAGDPKSAAAEFQKILDHGMVASWGITPTLARVGLARAHAAAGERDKALYDYETFLNQWKNADPDIPIFQQAKAEYAKLVSHP